MVDHINLELDDFDIEDTERTLPSYIFDLDLPLTEKFAKTLKRHSKM